MSSDIANILLRAKCPSSSLRNIILKKPKKEVCVHKDLADSGKK